MNAFTSHNETSLSAQGRSLPRRNGRAGMDPQQQVVLEAILVDPGIFKYTHSYRRDIIKLEGYYIVRSVADKNLF
jgi:hypothetical protein